MYEQLEILLLGFATVIDTVLLMIVYDRINRSLIAIWLKNLLIGTCVIHLATLLHVLARSEQEAAFRLFDSICLILVSGALLVLPSAMLHAAVRLNHSGFVAKPPADWRYLGLYAPISLLPLIVSQIGFQPASDFDLSQSNLLIPYLVELACVNIVAAFLFLRVRHRVDAPGAEAFFFQLAVVLIAMTLVVVAYSGIGSQYEPVFRLAAYAAPLMPITLFIWYTFRRQLLPLVIERTLVYCAFLVVFLLLHRLLVERVLVAMHRTTNLDVFLLEGIVMVAIILLCRPWRERIQEASRYLLSNNVFKVRDAIRRLSVELSRVQGEDSEQWLEWFAEAVCTQIGVERFSFWSLNDPDRIVGFPLSKLSECDTIERLVREMDRCNVSILDRGKLQVPTAMPSMEKLDRMLAFRVHFQSVDGVILLGNRHRNDRLSDEQVTSLAMLFEQFAATLHNRHLELLRRKAERESIQQEKLSMLGLIASSLAHELRNPLSSVRTISMLMREELTEDAPQFKDLSIIVSEIDRLAQSTNRLIEFSRPRIENETEVCLHRVIERSLHILDHYAKQYHVTLDTQIHTRDVSIPGTDSVVSEILFNLIRNAIDAVRDQSAGRVRIATELQVDKLVITVSDNGSGIPADLQVNMFEPFVTAKKDGTGLGLFVVRERVRELNGKITCHSTVGDGTIFEVQLPIATSTKPPQ